MKKKGGKREMNLEIKNRRKSDAIELFNEYYNTVTKVIEAIISGFIQNKRRKGRR